MKHLLLLISTVSLISSVMGETDPPAATGAAAAGTAAGTDPASGIEAGVT